MLYVNKSTQNIIVWNRYSGFKKCVRNCSIWWGHLRWERDWYRNKLFQIRSYKILWALYITSYYLGSGMAAFLTFYQDFYRVSWWPRSSQILFLNVLSTFICLKFFFISGNYKCTYDNHFETPSWTISPLKQYQHLTFSNT